MMNTVRTGILLLPATELLFAAGLLFTAGLLPPSAVAQEPPSPEEAPEARTVGEIALEACRRPRFDGWALCGTHDVWEDRTARAGRRIELHLAMLPATGEDPLPDPLFVFDGGPGQAASEAVHWAADAFAPLRERRHIVLVDRRGTGASNPLDCPEPEGEGNLQRYLEPVSSAALEACRELLEERADLGLYTTPIAVDDIDEVREAMGFERINLFGASYGSREAMVYLRRHPEHVRSAILQMVIPPHRRSVLQAPRMAQRSMDRLLDDCLADDRCRAAFPGIRSELREVMGRLEEAPGRFVPAEGPGGGDTLSLSRSLAAGTLRSLLISPGGGARVPALIHAAHGGDYRPLGELAIRFRRLTPTALSRGLFLSVTCTEEIPRLASAAVERAAAGTFWGDAWVRSLQRQCDGWPRGRLPEGYHAPPEGTAPVLVLQGWLDPVGPPAWALELPRHLPNARVVVVREGHHNFPTEGCVDGLMAAFVERLDVHGLDASCASEIRRPPFALPGDLP